MWSPYDALPDSAKSKVDLAVRLVQAVTKGMHLRERKDPAPDKGIRSSSLELNDPTSTQVPLVVIDEFGSSWDILTQHRVGAALNEELRHGPLCGRLRLLLASCHHAFVGRDALQPDWVFEAASQTLLVRNGHMDMGRETPRTCPAETRAPAMQSVLIQPPRGARNTYGASSKLTACVCTRASVQGEKGCVSRGSAHGDICLGDDKVESILFSPPSLGLHLSPCNPELWRRFAPFHYKSEHLSAVASTFLLSATIPAFHQAHLVYGIRSGACRCGADIGSPRSEISVCNPRRKTGRRNGHMVEPVMRIPVGFVATIPHSGKRSDSAAAAPRRAHRTVILPEWQGMGIGSRLSDAVAEWHRRRGADYFGQTVHPSFGRYRDASPFWKPTDFNHTRPELRLRGWRHRLAGVAVRVRDPKFIYSHSYHGPKDEHSRKRLQRRVVFAECRMGNRGGGSN